MRFLLLFLLPLNVFASSEGIPLKEISFQVLNFGLFLVLFLFFIRKPITSFFKKRREDFLLEEKTAREKESSVRKEHELWADRLKDLLVQEKDLKQQVETEGKKHRAQKKEDLLLLKERLSREQNFLIYLEQEKLKKQVLNKIKSEIFELTKKKLGDQAKEKMFHTELYKQFSKQLEQRI